VNSYYETVGQYNMDTELGFKWKTNTVKVSGGRNYFDGWKPEDEFIQFPKSLPADTNRVLSWKPKEQLFGKVTLRKKIKRNTVGLSSGYFREVLKNKGLPKTPYYESAFDDTYATRRWNNVLSFSRVPSKKSSLNLLFAYNYYKRFKHTSFVDLTTLEKSITTNLSDQDTSFFDLYMARGTYNKAIDSSKINFSVGYDINIEKAKGARIVKRIQQIGDFAMFGSLEYNPFKGFVIRPGLRYSYNTSYKAPLTPSVNLKYKIKYYTIRGSYSKGFRAPSIKDLYFDFVDVNHDIQGNPDLTAENSDNFSLSLQAVKKVKRNQYKANTSLFYNDISDLITMALKEGSNGSYSYFNLEQYKTMGMQIGGDLSIRYFKFSLVGTYTGRYNYLSDSIGVSVFNYSPQLRSNLNYKIKRNNLKFSLFYKYSGKVVGYYLDDEDEVKESLLGDFHTFDVTVSKGFWKNKVRWVIGCKNLFDVQSIQSTGDSGTHSDNSGSTPMSWGRSIFTSIKIDINKVYKKKE
jgi:outer membrane receptor for ferrienterochelin and colicins